MNIQSNINQTLSVAGLLLSQTPLAEQRRNISVQEAKKSAVKAEAEAKSEARKAKLAAPVDYWKQQLGDLKYEKTNTKTGKTSRAFLPHTAERDTNVASALKHVSALHAEFPSEETAQMKHYLEHYQKQGKPARQKAEAAKAAAAEATMLEQERLAASTPSKKEDTE